MGIESGRKHDESGSPLVHRIDLVVTLIILAICGALYYITTTFDEVSNMLAQNIPPEFFPRLVLMIIVGLTLALPFEHIFHRRRGGNIDSERQTRVKLLPYMSAGLLVALVIALPYLGGLLTIVGACVLLPLLWGERRLALILPFAAVFPVVVVVIFTQVLKVHFVPGVLGLSIN